MQNKIVLTKRLCEDDIVLLITWHLKQVMKWIVKETCVWSHKPKINIYKKLLRDILSLTQKFELLLQMGFVQIGRESPAWTLWAIQQTKDTPQGNQKQESKREPKKEPFVEADGLFIRKILLPHPHQYEIDTCPGKCAHPTNSSGVNHTQNHSPTELVFNVRLIGPRW